MELTSYEKEPKQSIKRRKGDNFNRLGIISNSFKSQWKTLHLFTLMVRIYLLLYNKQKCEVNFANYARRIKEFTVKKEAS